MDGFFDDWAGIAFAFIFTTALGPWLCVEGVMPLAPHSVQSSELLLTQLQVFCYNSPHYT